MTRLFVSFIVLVLNVRSWMSVPIASAAPPSSSTLPSQPTQQQQQQQHTDDNDSSCTGTATPQFQSIQNVIHAMNDPANFDFLKELLSQKSVTDVTYHHHQNDDDDNTNNDGAMIPASTTTSCEYTGHLWFLPKSKGIKFREKVNIVTPLPSSQTANKAIECQTSYHDGTKWIDCSKVTCQLRSSSNEDDTTCRSPSNDENLPKLNVMVETEMLMKIPLPGFAVKGIRRKIGSVFQTAVESFLDKYHV